MTADLVPAARPPLPPVALNATLVNRIDQTPSLARFWVRPDGPLAYEPGQYLTLGLPLHGRLVARPYSAASTCDEVHTGGIEFYVRRVEGGAFTPELWRLPLGARVRLTGPKGRFALLNDDPRVHLFVSSGTGSAPFVAMLRERIAAGRPPRCLVLSGVSHVADLGYRDLFDAWNGDPNVPIDFVPTISRPNDPANAKWTGRTGRVEVVLQSVVSDAGLRPAGAVAYLCGNPSMILASEHVLSTWGLPPDAIRAERYWPPDFPPNRSGQGSEASPVGR